MAVPPTAAMIGADKPALRSALRSRRARFAAELGPARDAAEDALAAQVIAHLSGCTTVAGYLAIGAEAGVTAILQAAARRGIGTALPHVTERGAPLRFLRWRAGDPLEDGPFGLLQPPASSPVATPDLILAPLVGFDRAGGRLGQGAGFYDRVFTADPSARRIGIAWSVQEMPALPLDAWDVPLHAIATEREWIEIDPTQAGASRSASS